MLADNVSQSAATRTGTTERKWTVQIAKYIFVNFISMVSFAFSLGLFLESRKNTSAAQLIVVVRSDSTEKFLSNASEKYTRDFLRDYNSCRHATVNRAHASFNTMGSKETDHFLLVSFRTSATTFSANSMASHKPNVPIPV